MIRQILNKAFERRSRLPVPAANAEPEALGNGQRAIEPDGLGLSPELQDIASGGRGAQRLAGRVLRRRMGDSHATRMSRNGLLSLGRPKISSRIHGRLARLNGNSSRINTLGGPPRLLAAGTGEPGGDSPTWLRARQPSSQPEEALVDYPSVHLVHQATRPPLSRGPDQNRSATIQQRNTAQGRGANQAIRPPSALTAEQPGLGQHPNSSLARATAEGLARKLDSAEFSGVGIIQRARALASRTKRLVSRQGELSRPVPLQAKPHETSQLSAALAHGKPATGIPAHSPQAQVPPEVVAPVSSPLMAGKPDHGTRTPQVPEPPGWTPGVASIAKRILIRSPRISRAAGNSSAEPAETVRKPSPVIAQSSGEAEGEEGGILQRGHRFVSRTKDLVFRKGGGARPTSPQSKPDETSNLTGRAAQPQLSAGAAGQQPDPQVPPRVGPAPSGPQRNGRPHHSVPTPQAPKLPPQSLGVSTLAGRPIARMPGLSRIITAPILRAIETLRNPPALLRRSSLGEQKRLRWMAPTAVQPPQPPAIARGLAGGAGKVGNDMGQGALAPIQLTPAARGLSVDNTTALTSRPWRLRPPALLNPKDDPALAVSRAQDLAGSPGADATGNRARHDDTGGVGYTAPAAGLTRDDTGRPSPYGPGPQGASSTSSSTPVVPGGILQRSRRLASKTAALLLRNGKAPGFTSIQRQPFLRRKSTRVGKGLRWSASTLFTPPKRTAGPSEVVREGDQRPDGAEEWRPAPLQPTGRGQGLSVNPPQVDLAGEGSRELRPPLHRQGDDAQAAPAAQSAAVVGDNPPADAWPPHATAQGPALLPSSRSSEGGPLSVLQRTRQLVSQTKDLVLRKKDEPELAEPRGNPEEVSRPPAGLIGRGGDPSTRELSPPLVKQQSHPLIARNAAVLVYRMAAEHGGHQGRSSYAPPEEQTESGTVATRTLRLGQSMRLGAQAEIPLLDIASPGAPDGSRQTMPGPLAEGAIHLARRITPFFQHAAGSEENTFVNAPGRQPVLVSRSIADEITHTGRTRRAGRNEGQGTSLNLLDFPKPEKRAEPLTLVLGSPRRSPAAGVTAGTPQEHTLATRVSPKRGPATGIVSRQAAGVQPPSQTIGRQVVAGTSANGPGEVSEVSRTVAPVPTEQKERTFNASEIEFLASKVYSYIKQKLVIEKERHGRPGFPWWP